MSSAQFAERLFNEVDRTLRAIDLGFTAFPKYRMLVGRCGEVFHVLRAYPSSNKNAKLVATIWHPVLLARHSFSDSLSLNTCGGEISPWGFRGSWHWDADDLELLQPSLVATAIPWFSGIASFSRFSELMLEDYEWVKASRSPVGELPKEIQKVRDASYAELSPHSTRPEFVASLTRWLASSKLSRSFRLEITEGQVRLVRPRENFVDVIDYRINGDGALVTPYVSIWNARLQNGAMDTRDIASLYNVNGGPLGNKGIGKGVGVLSANGDETFRAIEERVFASALPFFDDCTSFQRFVEIMSPHYLGSFASRYSTTA